MQHFILDRHQHAHSALTDIQANTHTYKIKVNQEVAEAAAITTWNSAPIAGRWDWAAAGGYCSHLSCSALSISKILSYPQLGATLGCWEAEKEMCVVGGGHVCNPTQSLDDQYLGSSLDRAPPPSPPIRPWVRIIITALFWTSMVDSRVRGRLWNMEKEVGGE